jgi:hypothetical protein
MLEQIEGHSALAIQRDNFTIDECIARKVRARLGDARKILGEEIFAPRPEPNAARIFSGETAVTVQLDFYIHSLLFCGSFATASASIGSMNFTGARGNDSRFKSLAYLNQGTPLRIGSIAMPDGITVLRDFFHGTTGQG